MYAQDTFFHLTMWGRVGLVFLSLFLSYVTVMCFWKISNRFGLAVKVLLAVVCLYIFIWLSPQLYYFYYMQLINGLPLQIVIQAPPSPLDIFHVISFSGKDNLSEHSKGVLFWFMIVLSLWKANIIHFPKT